MDVLVVNNMGSKAADFPVENGLAVVIVIVVILEVVARERDFVREIAHAFGANIGVRSC